MVFRVGLYPTGGHHRAKALGNADVPVIPGRDLRHGVLRGAGVAFGGAGLRRFLVGNSWLYCTVMQSNPCRRATLAA